MPSKPAMEAARELNTEWDINTPDEVLAEIIDAKFKSEREAAEEIIKLAKMRFETLAEGPLNMRMIAGESYRDILKLEEQYLTATGRE